MIGTLPSYGEPPSASHCPSKPFSDTLPGTTVHPYDAGAFPAGVRQSSENVDGLKSSPGDDHDHHLAQMAKRFHNRAPFSTR